ncbi:MAG TPA: patatin-like phospholipase family protein [Streptosporangiaceae bacterium]|nr:patatin-like phospholipase family protein [Streptosporangiaceae bacterium]
MPSAVRSDPAAPVPTRPAIYERTPEEQAAFEQAVARLWAEDAWVNPQTNRRELNADLVLEGGGVKGIGLAGAIMVLAEAGYRFPRTAGTSAGAIAAVLVAAIEKSGQDMTVLREYLNEVDYQQFMATSTLRRVFERVGGRFAEACELMFRPGLYSGDYLRTWLGAKLGECGVKTWADLAVTMADDPGMSLPADQRYRAVVHVSDISRGMLARLPWDYSDYYGLPGADQEVVAAVRASMSIPFFFVPVRTVAKPSQAHMPDGSVVSWPGGTVTWVDGGMLMNFPIDAFQRIDGAAPRWPTIGIKLSAEPGVQTADVPAGTTLQEGLRCLQTVTCEWDRYYVGRATADRTIFVPNAGLTATQFGLTAEQQQTLFLNGAQAATQFLIRWAGKGGVPRSDAQAAAEAARPALAAQAAGMPQG